MLRSIDFSNLGQSVIQLIMRLVIVLISLTFHEVAHGWMAYKLGDRTAKESGRLSLSPRAHLDPIGFLCMLLFGFGWAKPVPIDTRNFKKPRRDTALTGLAGPVANLLLAFVILIPFEILNSLIRIGTFDHVGDFGFNLISAIVIFVSTFHYMNITLALFNFFPVPPLDGSRVLYAVLPDKLYFGVMKYERYLSLVIMLLLWLGFLDYPLSFLSDAISGGMIWLLELLPFFG
ncbi:MAG: site-2 protease family protein [Clostridiales bacterium]|nr:site-2 protease family protein [Clostridiales bacterium]